jgi:DNA-binding HxlR family transcriptional regulator
MANPWERSQQLIGLIDGRWTLAVLAELLVEGRRYQELDEALDGGLAQSAHRSAPTG